MIFDKGPLPHNTYTITNVKPTQSNGINLFSFQFCIIFAK